MIITKTLQNESNENIFVETYIPEKIKSTIVFCHGITGCRKGRTKDDGYFQDLAKILMNQNYKVVLFDFSGHGDSEGNDYDVCLSKSTEELTKVFYSEVEDVNNVSFLAFSYGATVLCKFLSENVSIKPNRIVMYSPCFYPLESCFLNADSIFGKDIVKDYENGEMQKKGYAVVGAKGFRFGLKMLEDCRNFSPDYYKNFKDRMLVLSGKNDVILNTRYNDEFCKANNIPDIYLVASHSLFEDISTAFDKTLEFFNK